MAKIKKIETATIKPTDKKIIVYVGENEASDELIKKLKAKKVKFEERSVLKKEHQIELNKYGFLGTPVVAIGNLNNAFGGQDETRLREIINEI